MNWRILTLTVLIVLTGQSVFSQSDSLSHLTFQSSFEREQIDQQLNDLNQKGIGPFIAITGTVEDLLEAENTLSEIIDELKEMNLSKKSRSKKIRIIHTHVHDRLFKKYEHMNQFAEVFESGRYNCVSATVIYAIVFSKLSIPYSIRETPTHVYLIAYPKTDAILVESTDPTGKYFAMNDNFKKSYVEHLMEQKLVDATYVSTRGFEQVFNDYYFDDDRIAFSELIGIQYYNNAIYLLETEAYSEIVEILEKAKLFYNDQKIEFLLYYAIANELDRPNLDPEKKVKHLSTLYELDKDNLEQLILSSFWADIEESLDYSYDDADSLAKDYFEAFAGKTILKELQQDYFAEKGRRLFNEGRFNESTPLLEKALKSDPSNRQYRNSFGRSFINMNIKLPADRLYELMFTKQVDYPGLKKDGIWQTQLAQSALHHAYHSYINDNFETGDEYLYKFEETANNTEISITSTNIEITYIEAAKYHYRKSGKVKAKATIEKGLKYVEGSKLLLERLDIYK